MYDTYQGTGMQMALFFACILYLLVVKKAKEKRVFFTGYTLVFFIICFFPVTAKIIMDYCIGAEVYWRMFWLLPVPVLIAYTGAQILSDIPGRAKRAGMLAVMAGIIVLTGSCLYNGTLFQHKQNQYNLPNNTVEICDIIEQDAKENGITEKKLATVNEFLETVRQYDADILMPYGNEVVKGNKAESENASSLFRLMSSDVKNWQAISWYAAATDCNYLVSPVGTDTQAAVSVNGYQRVGGNASYDVYRRDQAKEWYQGKWLITQYGSNEGNQLMFYTMQDMEGHLVVVDGGWAADAEFVRQVLKAQGNHVDAWIITHPHRDHAGAFCEIWQNPGKLKVDQVYAVDMAPKELCLANAPWDETEAYDVWVTLDIPQLTYVHAGDRFQIGSLSVEVFNAYDDYVDEMSDDLLNDGSMMFKVTADQESMLFCADVGKKMSDYLLKTWGGQLKADYIQMGHHGNGGLKKDFYQQVGAKGAFFDAPEWLMQDKSGQFTTMENTALMAGEKAEIYSFATTPNQIVLQ